MALAKVDAGGLTITASGTLTLSQIDWWMEGSYPPASDTPVPPWYGQASAANTPGVASSFVEIWSPSRILVVRSTVGGTVTADETVTTIVADPPPSPPNPILATVIHESLSLAYEAETAGLNPYKERIWCEKPADLDSACHPLHGAVVNVWGSNDYSAQASLGAATKSLTALSLTPTYSVDGDGRPVAACVTRYLGPFVVRLGLSTTPSKALSGEVAAWSDLAFVVDGETIPIDLSALATTFSGLSAVGGNGTLTLSVTDHTSVPVGGAYVDATIQVPVVIDYDLRAFDWGVEIAPSFEIPNDGTDAGANPLRVVTAPFTERVIYGHSTGTWSGGSWDDGRVIPWSIAPAITSAWAAANSEDVTPSDLVCTLEEWGLSKPSAGTLFSCACFRVRRSPTMSVQCPWDAGGVLPSAWATASTGLSVAQVGMDTTVTVASTASNGSITRTLAYTPSGTRRTKHAADEDVYCWSQWQFLRATYASDRAWTGTLTVTHTGGSVAYTFPFAATAGDTVQVDLQVPAEVDLREVTALALSGLTGAGADWYFTLSDLQLVAHNPTTFADTGWFDTKVVFNRPDTGGVPISQVGATFTADGLRACRPIGATVDLAGEEGIDFCDRDATNPRMLTLPEWVALWDSQEGVWVEDADASPLPCENGHATYDGAFVANSLDMLGDALQSGDVGEGIDMALSTSSSAYTTLPVRPRVGVIYPCAGFAVPVSVRKILHGNLHGLMRLSTGARAGAGVGASVWELQGATYVLAATGDSDQYSRWTCQAGGRETYELRGAAGTATPTSGSTQTYNELRAWEDLEYTPPSNCPKVALTEDAPDGQRWRCRGIEGELWVQRSVDGGRTWGSAAMVCAGQTPTLWRTHDGGVWLGYVAGSGASSEVRARNIAPIGGASTLLLSGMTCAGFGPSRFLAAAHIAALDSTPDLYYARALWVPGTGYVADATLAVTVDTGVDAVCPTPCEEATGALVIHYEKAGNFVAKKSVDGGATWAVI